MRKLIFAVLLIVATSPLMTAQTGIQFNSEMLEHVSLEVTIDPLRFAFDDESVYGSDNDLSDVFQLLHYNDMLRGDSLQIGIDLSRPFGRNGLQGSGFNISFGYAWGSQNPDQTPHPWELSIGFGNGVYRQGTGLRTWIGIQKVVIGSSMGMFSTTHESKFYFKLSLGAKIGVDGSFRRRPSQIGLDIYAQQKSNDDAVLYGLTPVETSQNAKELERLITNLSPKFVGGSSISGSFSLALEEKFVMTDQLEFFAQLSGQYDLLGKLFNTTGRAQHSMQISLGMRWNPFID